MSSGLNNRYSVLNDDENGTNAAASEKRPTEPTGEEKQEPPAQERESNQPAAERPAVPTPVVKPGEHPLQYTYCIWFSRKPAANTRVNYEENVKLVGVFCTVEQFWAYYMHCLRPSELGNHTNVHIFKDGIRPMWEDDANKQGGQWIVRLRKGLASRCWENVVMAMLGEQFMVGEEICGAVLSVRYQEDIISVWNKTATETAITARIRDTMSRALSLPTNTIMEYKAHSHSLRDNSSYRNTEMFVR